jgi:hypothetical protein
MQNEYVARYISGQTIKAIATELCMTSQEVQNHIYTSDDFVSWVLAKPVNTPQFIARYLEVFTNNRARDCDILGCGQVQYNHLKHALITSGRLKAPRRGIYTEKQVKAIDKWVSRPEVKNVPDRVITRAGLNPTSLHGIIKRATGMRVREWRTMSGLSFAQLQRELGVSKSLVDRCIANGLLTMPYEIDQIANLLRRGLAMLVGTNTADPRWHRLIASVRDTMRYKYISTRYLYDILPATSRGIHYHTKDLQVHLRLYPNQNNLFAYDREDVARVVGEWLGPKYRWAVRQVDADWTPLKCKWYTWKTS